MVAALFAAPGPLAVARSHVVAMMGAGIPAGALLAALAGADQPDPGATVCACFNSDANTIAEAVRTRGLVTAEQVGAALEAGTNCGSCRSEIRALIAAHGRREAAE